MEPVVFDFFGLSVWERAGEDDVVIEVVQDKSVLVAARGPSGESGRLIGVGFPKGVFGHGGHENILYCRILRLLCWGNIEGCR
jgi:hypothetical protein